jgi:hypothetical protein
VLDQRLLLPVGVHVLDLLEPGGRVPASPACLQLQSKTPQRLLTEEGSKLKEQFASNYFKTRSGLSAYGRVQETLQSILSFHTKNLAFFTRVNRPSGKMVAFLLNNRIRPHFIFLKHGVVTAISASIKL